VCDVVLGEDFAGDAGFDVGLGVAGHQFLDRDAEFVEVLDAAFDEISAGLPGFVVEDFGVGVARVVVDHRVHVLVAETVTAGGDSAYVP
jgi:hypothetical protein